MPDQPQQLLSFDYGKARIGVAVGQAFTGSANALTTVVGPYGKPNWDKIIQLIAEWAPDIIIVGLPLRSQGEESKLTVAAREFADELHQRCKLPIELFDERLSSSEAENRFKELRKQGQLKAKDKIKLDAMSAQIILQGWMWENLK